MNDHPDSTGPDDPAGSTSPDAELSADKLDQLVGRLRDVPTPTASVRAAHLAVALDAYDALPSTSTTISDPPPVTPVAPVTAISAGRRRRQRMVQRWAAAAALVLVAGLGVGLAVQANGSSDDTAADTASASQAKADEQMASENGADAAAPEPASAAAGSQEIVGAPTVLQLGDVSDDKELRFALVAGRRAAAAQSTREAADVGENDSSGMAVGGSEAPITTAANAPAADQPSCTSSYPPGSVVVAAATLDGRPIVVVETPGSSAGTPTVTTVVDLTDCSTRQL